MGVRYDYSLRFNAQFLGWHCCQSVFRAFDIHPLACAPEYLSVMLTSLFRCIHQYTDTFSVLDVFFDQHPRKKWMCPHTCEILIVCPSRPPVTFLCPLESMLPIIEHTKRWDLGDREGSVHSSWWQHIKRESYFFLMHYYRPDIITVNVTIFSVFYTDELTACNSFCRLIQLVSPRTSLPSRPDRGWECGDLWGFGFCHSEVGCGSVTHTLLLHSTLRGLHPPQRYYYFVPPLLHAYDISQQLGWLCFSPFLFVYFTGFADRFLSKMKKLAAKDVKLKVHA